MAAKVVINHAALEAAMRSPQATEAARHRAQEAADAIRAMGIEVGASDGGGRIELPVEVVDDPAIEGVALVLAHPAGEAVQAKYGALTKGAAEVGLIVDGA